MKLVVDAKVLFSAAITDSATARLILRDDIGRYAPAHLFDEFENHRETLLKRPHRESDGFTRFTPILRRRISIVPRPACSRYGPAAQRVCPDPGDIPSFALALALEARLRRDDRALQDQSAVPAATTAGPIERLDP